MLRKLSIIIVCFSLAALSHNAFGQSKLNGVTYYSEFGKELFIAGIYAKEPSSDAQALANNNAQRLEVRVLAPKLRYRSFRRLWLEGIAINNDEATLKRQTKNITLFSELLKTNLVQNDIFSISKERNKIAVAINGIPLGRIPDTSFFNVLLSVWTGNVPPSTAFKQQLLVAGNIDDAMRQRFVAVKPDRKRIAELVSLLAPPKPVAKAEKPKVEAKKPAPKPVVKAKPKKAPPKVVKPVKKTVAKKVAKPKPKPVPKPKKVVAKKKPEPKPSKEQALITARFVEQQQYFLQLRKWTQRFVEYPKRAARKQQEGVIELGVMIDRTGNVVQTETIASSGNKTLDKAAKKAVENASPYPPMPDSMDADSYRFTVPVVFKLTN